MKVKVNVINTCYISMSEVVTVPSLMMMTWILWGIACDAQMHMGRLLHCLYFFKVVSEFEKRNEQCLQGGSGDVHIQCVCVCVVTWMPLSDNSKSNCTCVVIMVVLCACGVMEWKRSGFSFSQSCVKLNTLRRFSNNICVWDDAMWFILLEENGYFPSDLDVALTF